MEQNELGHYYDLDGKKKDFDFFVRFCCLVPSLSFT